MSVSSFWAAKFIVLRNPDLLYGEKFRPYDVGVLGVCACVVFAGNVPRYVFHAGFGLYFIPGVGVMVYVFDLHTVWDGVPRGT